MKRAVVFSVIFIACALSFLTAQENNALDNPASDEAEAGLFEDSVEGDILRFIEKAEETAHKSLDPDKPPIMDFVIRFGIALGVIATQALLIWLLWLFFKFFSGKAVHAGKDRFKPLVIKKLKLLTTKQIISAIQFSLRILKYVITAFMLFLTIPIVFSLFPATRHLALTIFSYIINPVRDIASGAIEYIPNLFTIIIIVIITRYVLKGIKFFSIQIGRGKLVIPGFYAEWAPPTYKILQVLLWAFTLAVVYPYLPGSDSRIFQGISVFVGLIFSFGSSSVIGNLVAGLVITYMRPFNIGDRVNIKDITGFVVEKNLMVVRLKTDKNEYVTFPNMVILNSSTINYHTSSYGESQGLVLNTEITFGYATPWQTIHEILIKAALETQYVEQQPRPFVLQTGLDDFYARYQINCYTKEIDRVPAIYAKLRENIQNGFQAAGLDMTAPHFYTQGG